MFLFWYKVFFKGTGHDTGFTVYLGKLRSQKAPAGAAALANAGYAVSEDAEASIRSHEISLPVAPAAASPLLAERQRQDLLAALASVVEALEILETARAA